MFSTPKIFVNVTPQAPIRETIAAPNLFLHALANPRPAFPLVSLRHCAPPPVPPPVPPVYQTLLI